MDDPQTLRVKKIVEEVSGSDDEAFEQIKRALLKEFVTDINNKLTLPLTTLKSLSDKKTVEDKLIGLSAQELAKAVELLKKLNGHLE